jgi:hypothetical protein
VGWVAEMVGGARAEVKVGVTVVVEKEDGKVAAVEGKGAEVRAAAREGLVARLEGMLAKVVILAAVAVMAGEMVAVPVGSGAAAVVEQVVWRAR